MKSAADWPAANVELRAVSSLVPYARNSRTHSAEQVDQIVASMREWGWTNPVLVDEAGMISGRMASGRGSNGALRSVRRF